MGFLANIFKSKELIYLEQLYKDTKEDKKTLELKVQRLEQENKNLLEELTNIKLNNKSINIKDINLTKKEEYIYKHYLNLKTKVSLIEFAQRTNTPINSLKVYVSRIRKKQKELIFN